MAMCDRDHLHDLYDRLNARWWDGRLPSIPLRWSRRMHAAAGKYWRSRVRGWEIVLSVPYHEHFPDEVTDTLKHEMVHVWQHVNGFLKPGGAHHGREFQREAERVGAPRHCRTYPGLRRPLKYEWACPNCGRRARSRVRWVRACRPCCDRHNRGRFSVRYQLRLVRVLSEADARATAASG